MKNLNNIMNNKETLEEFIMQFNLWRRKPFEERLKIAKDIAKKVASHSSFRSDPFTFHRVCSNLLTGPYSPEDFKQYMRQVSI